MGWLIALAVLILLGCLPLGIKACYDAAGPSVALIIGPARVPVFPGKKKAKRKKFGLTLKSRKLFKRKLRLLKTRRTLLIKQKKPCTILKKF